MVASIQRARLHDWRWMPNDGSDDSKAKRWDCELSVKRWRSEIQRDENVRLVTDVQRLDLPFELEPALALCRNHALKI